MTSNVVTFTAKPKIRPFYDRLSERATEQLKYALSNRDIEFLTLWLKLVLEDFPEATQTTHPYLFQFAEDTESVWFSIFTCLLSFTKPPPIAVEFLNYSDRQFRVVLRIGIGVEFGIGVVKVDEPSGENDLSTYLDKEPYSNRNLPRELPIVEFNPKRNTAIKFENQYVDPIDIEELMQIFTNNAIYKTGGFHIQRDTEGGFVRLFYAAISPELLMCEFSCLICTEVYNADTVETPILSHSGGFWGRLKHSWDELTRK